MEWMVAPCDPLRSSVKSWPFWVSKTRIKVPLLDDVASKLPWIFKVMQLNLKKNTIIFVIFNYQILTTNLYTACSTDLRTFSHDKNTGCLNTGNILIQWGLKNPNVFGLQMVESVQFMVLNIWNWNNFFNKSRYLSINRRFFSRSRIYGSLVTPSK